MKKFIIALLIILMASGVVFAQDNLNYTEPRQYDKPTTPTPKVQDVEVLKFIESVSVQIIVPTTRWFRLLSWYKLEEGQIDHEALDRYKDQWGYKWFKQGWKVEKGQWEKKEEFITIYGSGVILYSKILDEGLRIDGKTHGATYILTNAHVVDILIDYYSNIDYEKCGSMGEPLDVYYPQDIIEYTYPPSIKIKEGAKPYEQNYFVPISNYVNIKHSESQLYKVIAEIVGFDMALDIALLKLNNVWGLPYAVFRGTPCQVGEEVWICGSPLGIFRSIDKGRINQVNLNLGEGYGIIWNNQIKMDIAAAPGSSGSGIFDIYGSLIAEEHGVLVHNGNYISGGHLAIDGMAIREWLIWNGYSFIVEQKPYGEVFITTDNIKYITQ